MSRRITRREFHNSAQRLVDALPKIEGHFWRIEQHNPGDGKTRIRVVLVDDEHHGETHPFGDRCFIGYREASDAFYFAARVAEVCLKGGLSWA